MIDIDKFEKAAFSPLDLLWMTDNGLLELIKYFHGDNKFILRLLSNSKVIQHLFYKPQTIRYLLSNQSGLTDKDKLKLIRLDKLN